MRHTASLAFFFLGGILACALCASPVAAQETTTTTTSTDTSDGTGTATTGSDLSDLVDEIDDLAERVDGSTIEKVLLPLLTAVLAAAAALLGSWVSNRGAATVATAEREAHARQLLLDRLDANLTELLAEVSVTARASMLLMSADPASDSEAQLTLRSALVELELRRALVPPWLLPPDSLDQFSAEVTSLLEERSPDKLEALGNTAGRVSDAIGTSSDRLVRLRDESLAEDVLQPTKEINK